ncbi:cellulase family glycosylhydrolase [Streptomyces sp. ME19-01-6]|uniref:cellulase family glycosylhydrolase n=1 Tax=Streptomyces sp. ME19-01-6 TaxID=3028686 RepID=UPI0029A65C25|nr:cellulase family glycosylhydrolase [Streptomyces sp. ME19-01-6]MDX3230397.1 cellulase family glycosylhydrolase [Streptomyces sp. ME19-01-6]
MAGGAAAVLVISSHSGAALARTSEPPAGVAVDFGSTQGPLPRPEAHNNFGSLNSWPQQRADDVAFLNRQGLHGQIYRVWVSSPKAPAESNVFNLCHLETQSCDLSILDGYLTDASTVSDELLVNVNPTAFVEGKRPWKDLAPMLELIIRSLKEKYPRVTYIEAFNEPDWQFHGEQRHDGHPAEETTLQPDGLYRYYAPFYEAVDKVNKKLRPADRIKVGGPSLSLMDPKWVKPFLDAYAADRNPRKRLDFLSYHSYLEWDDDYQVAKPYKDDLRVVASQRKILQGWLKERRLDQHLPAFITETGIYPGPSFDDTGPRKDYIRQAAAMATYGYLYANQPGTQLFNWNVRHRVEERKDQLVTRTPNGPLKDTFTPYGNMMLMQSKMKDTRVSAVAEAALEGDNGLYAMASKDRSGASLMVWNWQHVGDRSYRATITMSRIPSQLRHGPVRERVYRIDQTASNYFGDPAKASLQLVKERIVRLGKTYTETVDLPPNAIHLILLERS